ncbi:bifunctional serine/threonine-protein kinase/glutamate ABC transporter substrate-binding protein [Streptomyces physcomitrii]|uniref:non-specific serine/threonine protein kinase n=1 Tax=Streptomyces physcomitrii TaxID=2724184 RepID=A0ABX1H609_9ACTN|nr:transporter substrate-binding domain-containing protein [Streptomyces physcomitrii]
MIDDRFELVRRLGGGGMGVVWLARDLVLHRDVALKEVHPPDPGLASYDPEAAAALRARVLREARALARIVHPNVVTMHHIIDRGERTYPLLVMELVTGGSLQDLLDRGTLPPVEAATLGRGILAGLRAAHAAHIQHRDIKPPNILLRGDGHPLLTDFGIAAVHGSTVLTVAGSVIGTPDYMAPERVAGQDGGPAADLWSLALTLYVAVEGRNPLRRANTLATLAAVLSEDVPPPRQAGPLTRALTAVLVRDPALRPDAEALDRLLAEAEAGGGAENGDVTGAGAGTADGGTDGPDAQARAASAAAPGAPDFTPAAPDSAAASGSVPVSGAAAVSGSAPDGVTSYPLAPPGVPSAQGTSPVGEPGPYSSRLSYGAPPVSTPPPPAAPPGAPSPTGRPGRRALAYAAGAGAAALAGVLLWTLLPTGGDGDRTDAGDGSSRPSASGKDPAASSGGSSGTPAGEEPGGAKLTVGVKFDQPGLGLKTSDGGYRGFDIDVATYLARALGHEPSEIAWKEAPSSRREAMLDNGDVDLVVATYAMTDARAEKIDFVGPYLVAHQDVLLRAEDDSVREAADLNGKKVCAITGSTSAFALRTSAPGAVVESRDTYSRCMEELDEGSVDAVTTDDAILAGYAARKPDAYRLGGLALSDERYGIGLPQDSKLKAKITAALKDMTADGSWDRARRKSLPLLEAEPPTPA